MRTRSAWHPQPATSLRQLLEVVLQLGIAGLDEITALDRVGACLDLRTKGAGAAAGATLMSPTATNLT